MTITTSALPLRAGSGLPAVLVAGLALCLTGCAGGGGASSPGQPAGTATSAGKTSTASGAPAAAVRGVSACTLVTEQDASTALGAAAGPAKSAVVAGGSRCIYGNGALIVSTDAQGKTAYDKGRAAIKSAPSGTWAQVSGLGDGAFVAHGGPIASVEFYKGTTMVSIILSGSGPSRRPRPPLPSPGRPQRVCDSRLQGRTLA